MTNGIIIVGVLWVLSSLGQMITLCDWAWYQYTFSNQHLSDVMILVRYIGSWLQRILGLVGGMGLILQRRWAAKLVVFVSLFNIITVYGKHPYEAFVKQVAVFEQRYVGLFSQWGLEHMSVPTIARYVTITSCVVDVAAFGFFAYYLTRPRVKACLK